MMTGQEITLFIGEKEQQGLFQMHLMVMTVDGVGQSMIWIVHWTIMMKTH